MTPFTMPSGLYLEQYGDPMVTNTYLKIALALLSLVCVGAGAD